MAWGGRCRRGSDRQRRGSAKAWIGAWVGDVDDELQPGVERPELIDGDESE